MARFELARLRAVAGLAVVALALAGCTVAPLYGRTAGGGLVPERLAAVAVAPVGDRVSQIVRNELIFAFTGGGLPAAPLYDLTFSTAVVEIPFGVNPAGTAPSYSVEVRVRYRLVEIATASVVGEGSTTGVADYSRSNQAFANVQARRDAEDRAAAAAADQLRLRVSAALASAG